MPKRDYYSRAFVAKVLKCPAYHLTKGVREGQIKHRKKRGQKHLVEISLTSATEYVKNNPLRTSNVEETTDITVAEAAQILGLAVNTVRAYMSRGRLELSRAGVREYLRKKATGDAGENDRVLREEQRMVNELRSKMAPYETASTAEEPHDSSDLDMIGDLTLQSAQVKFRKDQADAKRAETNQLIAELDYKKKAGMVCDVEDLRTTAAHLAVAIVSFQRALPMRITVGIAPILDRLVDRETARTIEAEIRGAIANQSQELRTQLAQQCKEMTGSPAMLEQARKLAEFWETT